jgi:hypothetical protein
MKINWRFDRKTARRKFGHKRPRITPVKELEVILRPTNRKELCHRLIDSLDSYLSGNLLAEAVAEGIVSHGEQIWPEMERASGLSSPGIAPQKTEKGRPRCAGTPQSG